MNSSDEFNKTDNQVEAGSKGSGKVLPFRKPAGVQPTLQRRPGLNHAQKRKAGSLKKNEKTETWKGNVARWTYVGLLIIAITLALRDCGKL